MIGAGGLPEKKSPVQCWKKILRKGNTRRKLQANVRNT